MRWTVISWILSSCYISRASNALIDKDKECIQLTNEFKVLEQNLMAKKAEYSGLYFSIWKI